MSLTFCSRTILIAGRPIVLSLPADPEQLLHQALQDEADGQSASDPNWGLLWAAAPKTAELILRTQWERSHRAIDMGCGVGLTGIAALLAGHSVVFSDHAAAAVETSLSNACANGFSGKEGLVFEWSDPPDRQFDVAFASDVLYDVSQHRSLLRALEALLHPGGIAWIGDEGRSTMPQFLQLADESGWRLKFRRVDGELVSRPELQTYNLIELHR